MRVIVSVTDRDAPARTGHVAPGAAVLDPFARALCAAGLRVVTQRLATAADVAGSTWAGRLGIPRRRIAWLLIARKPAAPTGPELQARTARATASR